MTQPNRLSRFYRRIAADQRKQTQDTFCRVRGDAPNYQRALKLAVTNDAGADDIAWAHAELTRLHLND